MPVQFKSVVTLLMLVSFICAHSWGQEPAAPAGGEPKLEVLNTGGATKVRLRMKPAVGDKVRMKMRLATEQTGTMDGQPMPSADSPPIVISAELEVTNVAANGEMTYTFEYAKLDAEGDDFAAQQVRQGLQGMKGMKGVVVVTDRGIVKSATFHDEGLPPETRQMFSQLEQNMGQMSAPLPEEPVGIGAQWRLSQHLDVSIMKIDLITTYELQAFDENSAVLIVAVEQSAPEQNMNVPGVPPGMSAHLKQMKLAGKGEMKILFDRLVPESSTVESAGTMKMEMSAQGQRMHMDQSVKTTIELTSQKID